MRSRVMKLMKLSVFIANRQFFYIVYSCRRLYLEVTKKSIIIFTKENIFFCQDLLLLGHTSVQIKQCKL